MNNNLWQNISTEVIQKIATARAKQSFPTNTNIEVEIQFGNFKPPKKGEKFGRFESALRPEAFRRVIDYMKKVSGSPDKESVIEDRLNDSFRESENTLRKRTRYYSKYKIWSSYNVFKDTQTNEFVNVSTSSGNELAKELNTRITVSNEVSYADLEDFNYEFIRIQKNKLIRQRSSKRPEDFSPKIIRTKHRVTYDIPEVGYLDLTEATEINLDTNYSSPTKYEVELEIESTKFSPDNQKIVKWYNKILELIQDTNLIYTNTEKEKLYKYVADKLHLPSEKITYSLVAEARDLKMEDMVYGGIVGNTETEYCVTHKADGVRKWMVFTPSGVWALMPGTPSLSLFYRCTEKKDMDGNPSFFCPYDAGYIFDGELIPEANRMDNIESQNIFYVFDCICAHGEDIRNSPLYGERMNKAVAFNEYKFEDKKLNDILSVQIKGYKVLKGPNHFFETMKLMFYEQNKNPFQPTMKQKANSTLPYKEDGFMFIPLNTVYNPYEDESIEHPDIYNRTLVHNPDICKWKPKDERTIDFIVKMVQLADGRKKIVLEAIHIEDGPDKKRVNKVFEGSSKYPLNNRIEISDPLLSNLQVNAIVEFRWDEKKELLVPTRLRPDKISPNRYFSAINIWNGIFNGIEAKTLAGGSFQLMRAYHNQIKLDLYMQIIPQRCHKVLLDIGSGIGGDIRKWSDLEMVVAVEPNEEHRKELLSRLETSTAKDKVIIVPTGGEDYNTITNVIQERYGEKVCAVSLMLSLSFFHGELRDKLKKTIEDNLQIGGEVLILTIDGDTVQEVFVPSSGQYVEKTFQFLDCTMTYEQVKEGNEGKLFIDIPGSIVSQQEEVPPKLSVLFKEWENFLPLDVSRADKQKFLNPDEKTVSNMYTSLRMVYLGEKRSEIEVERIVPYGGIDFEYTKVLTSFQSNPNLYKWAKLPKVKKYLGYEDSNADIFLFGISVYPSQYLFLSSVLKAIDEDYQNDNHMEFRNRYVQDAWEQIKNSLPRQEREKYSFPWTAQIFELFANYFEIKILYIGDPSGSVSFGNQYEKKIIIANQYILAQLNDRDLLETVFE
jgi:hypothetical protein